MANKKSLLCQVGIHSNVRKPLYRLADFKKENKHVIVGYTVTCTRVGCTHRKKVFKK